MAKHKHLTFEERQIISDLLDKCYSFKAIGSELDKDCTTISKEIRNHLVYKKTGAYGYSYNACIHRYSCDHRLLCTPCFSSRHYNFCRFCKNCNSHCPDFQQDFCSRHSKPPYVCNGCDQLKRCTLEKHFYRADLADAEYKAVRAESRSGISLSEGEIKRLDSLVSPLIKKGQSLNHICVNNKDSIMLSESTLYRLVDYNLFSAINLDLPRKVRYKPRKSKKIYKVDKLCRIGRKFEDYLAFVENNPQLPIVELDSVEGRRGGKVLLTIHFPKAEFMLAFIRNCNDSQSVIDIMELLYTKLQPANFKKLFAVCLTDNGSEFSNPKALEFDQLHDQRTRVFYCDPGSPQQKGSAECNHAQIRRFSPKGKSMDSYTQADISLMMDHINSLCRPSLGNKTPYDVFAFLYGQDILDRLDCHKIAGNDVVLNNSLFRKKALDNNQQLKEN